MKRRSSASQMTLDYGIMLIIITIITSFAVMAVVGSMFVVNTRSNSDQLIGSLSNSVVDGQFDWKYWKANNDVDTRNTFIAVTTKDNNKVVKKQYSENAEEFLYKSFRSWPVLKNVQVRENQGIYYHADRVVHFTSDSGQPRQIKYQIWISLNRVINLFKKLFIVILSINLFSFVLGLIVISKLANKLTRPLKSLVSETKQIINSPTAMYQSNLTVADNPKEVHDLTIEFNKLLNELNENIKRDRQFISDASHELRTPIAGIKGNVKLIQRRADEHPEVVPESLNYIEAESDKMQNLVESLLALSKVDKVELSFIGVDVLATINETAGVMRRQIDQTIQVSGVETSRVVTNKNSLQQILVTLLDNAQKYSPKDSIIEINQIETDSEIQISVADQGIGMSEEDKQHIFDRFYRGEAARNAKIEGTGLGLAITARMAELIYAKLTVTNNQPNGTKFILTIPKHISEKF
ncbi:sensor histidine kinase [Paucilactobacillus nenjiangensis]|jgi:signal transduction histidine kinase|uniref:sensor histidine kinase n=1 Tax=Paucilactobacillus nenjiangensis TaxID=1296540 RepID=UPI001476DC63|nr:HAMP domain-containing sensor histidine kinase [Paucilactobacillus nenjiangensis]